VPAVWTDKPSPPKLAPRGKPADGRVFPRVSVVLPTYKRPHLIGRTIRSLLTQTFEDFELLVRDDGKGDDGTEESVRAASAGDPRVRYHRNPENLRMPGNLNSGIEASVGEFIAVCHDHDLYHPDFLAEYVRLLDKHPTALFAHAGIEMVDQEDKPLGEVMVSDWAELTKGREWAEFMLSSLTCPVCALTMVRREVHERFGLYDPLYGFIADVEMWLRLSLRGDVAYASRPLIRVRTREDGHDVTVNPWPILAITFAIHRRYLPEVCHGKELVTRRLRLEGRADVAVLREIGSRLRRGTPIGLGTSAGTLRERTGPLSRVLLPLVGPLESLVRMVKP